MTLTSADFTDVWPVTPQPSVSARTLTPVVNEDVDTHRLQLMVDAMQHDFEQRTHMFIVTLVVTTMFLLHRIGRLRQRIMIQTLGADPRRHWW